MSAAPDRRRPLSQFAQAILLNAKGNNIKPKVVFHFENPSTCHWPTGDLYQSRVQHQHDIKARFHSYSISPPNSPTITHVDREPQGCLDR